MVNQLLAGVHIASAAEAVAFGARLGLDTRLLFDFITTSGGTSWYVCTMKQSFSPLCSSHGQIRKIRNKIEVTQILLFFLKYFHTFIISFEVTIVFMASL